MISCANMRVDGTYLQYVVIGNPDRRRNLFRNR